MKHYYKYEMTSKIKIRMILIEEDGEEFDYEYFHPDESDTGIEAGSNEGIREMSQAVDRVQFIFKTMNVME